MSEEPITITYLSVYFTIKWVPCVIVARAMRDGAMCRIVDVVSIDVGYFPAPSARTKDFVTKREIGKRKRVSQLYVGDIDFRIERDPRFPTISNFYANGARLNLARHRDVVLAQYLCGLAGVSFSQSSYNI